MTDVGWHFTCSVTFMDILSRFAFHDYGYFLNLLNLRNSTLFYSLK